MRTTVTLDDDVAAAVEGLRSAEGIGVSEAVNRLVRDGLTRPAPSKPYVHQSYDMGLKVDVTNIGEVLGWLAIEHGLVVMSADSDFARFLEVLWENPLA